MYEPKSEHKFTFGLWTVGNVGRDPFGSPVREAKSAVELVHLLAEVGAWGVNLHDNDLVPIDGLVPAGVGANGHSRPHGHDKPVRRPRLS